MNWIDLVIIGLIVFFALEALGRPFIIELLDFASFLLAGLLSFRYYNIPAKFLENKINIPHGFALVLGFMSIWFLSEALFYILARLSLSKIPKIKAPFLQYFSIVPAVLRGLIFIAITLVMIASFPIQPVVKKAVLESKIGSQILKYSYKLEQPVKQVFGGAANESLTFLTIKPRTDERINLGFQTNQFSPDEVSEKEMINLVNKERVRRDLKALVFDSKLREVAREHSSDMFRKGYFSHYSPENQTVADRAFKNDVDFLVIGENLAFAPSLEAAHQGLMNSEGHKANILSTDFGKVGIGVMDGGVYGKMFVQVFTN